MNVALLRDIWRREIIQMYYSIPIAKHVRLDLEQWSMLGASHLVFDKIDTWQVLDTLGLGS